MYRIITIFFLLFTALCAAAQDGNYENAEVRSGFFRRIFKNEKKSKQESVRKITVPRTETVRWLNENMVPAEDFIDRFEMTVPDSVPKIELFMTNPVNGWYVEGKVINALNGGADIHKNDFYSYLDYKRIASVALQNEVSIVPVFDLSDYNLFFSETTGHEMLSVEGWRFARALIKEFLEETQTDSIAFAVPEGKYRKFIEEIMVGYPDTAYYYIN